MALYILDYALDGSLFVRVNNDEDATGQAREVKLTQPSVSNIKPLKQLL